LTALIANLINHKNKPMDFSLTKHEELFLQMIKEFAEKEVKPLAAEIDERERFPTETVEKMSKLGLMGIPFPVEYGGAGGTNQIYSMAVEELSRICGTTGVVVSAHTSLCCAPIYESGTEEQKRKYLPKLCSGEWLGAFGLTEPNAGTDAAGQQTTAVATEEGYVLNGNKIFITNAEYAHVYIVIAMTDKSLGTKGISAFIVEKGTPGFSIGKKEKKLGIRGSATCELIFENCVIPKENLLGKVNEGFKIAMKTLDGGRIGIAAQALGIAQGAMDETVKYTKERKQFGKSISQFQNTQFQLADLETKIQASRLLVRVAAYKKDKKMPYSVDAAQAKLFAAETAMEVTVKAVQFHGGYGYTRDYPVERMMRDAKITEIYEGTSEVQRMVISANLLKK
jgi:butyryl-CoA dehydrogenase